MGFYVDAPVDERPARVSVRVRHPGLQAIHPSRYVFRSPSDKRQSALRAAWIAPEMFQTGIVRAHAFPLRPTAGRAWEALLAVSFAVPLADSGGREVARTFGASLHGGAGLHHRFARTVRLRPDHAGVDSEPWITFLERVELAPGTYVLTAVVSDPLDERPHATRVPIELPRIRRGELFLVDPILGRPSGPNLIVMGGGGHGDGDALGAENAFEPLLVQRVDGPVDLVSLTQACLVGKKQGKREARTAVRRSVRRAGGGTLGELDPVPLELDGRERVRCQSLVDILPGGSFGDGDYVLEIGLDAGQSSLQALRRLPFAVGAGDDDATTAATAE